MNTSRSRPALARAVAALRVFLSSLRFMSFVSRSEKAEQEARRQIQQSGLFDAQWYRTNYAAVLGDGEPLDHYLQKGWRLGLWPGPHFDAPRYLKMHTDVDAAGVEPLQHFISHGVHEGRQGVIFDDDASDAETALLAKVRALVRPRGEKAAPLSATNDFVDAGLLEIIGPLSPGREVVEIGYQGRASLERAVQALLHGARGARIATPDPPQGLIEDLRRVACEMGAKGLVTRYLERIDASNAQGSWQPFWTEPTSRQWPLEAHFYERDLKNKVGPLDLLICPSGVSTAFEVLKVLGRLAYLSDDLVLFGLPVIEPFEIKIDGRAIAFRDQDIWFTGDMDASQAEAMANYWAKRNRPLAQFEGPTDRAASTRTAAIGAAEVQWWFVGALGLAKLLDLAGLDLIEATRLPDDHTAAVLARTRRSPEARA